MSRIKHCDGCMFLSISEEEQNRQKELYPHLPMPEHWCVRYNQQLKHGGHHPQIVALSYCESKFASGQELVEQYDKLRKEHGTFVYLLRQITNVTGIDCPSCGRIRGHLESCILGIAEKAIKQIDGGIT